METDHRNVAGKSAGEVARDISAFLSRTCKVQGRKEMDLANLLPDMNMREQFSFALLSEARAQGWDPTYAEGFYLRACGNQVGSAVSSAMIAAFQDPESESFRNYLEKYGCEFSLSSRSYWSSCLAIAIDAQSVDVLMEYLRAFTLCLLEFAYMEDRNPNITYAWQYYGSFQKILKELSDGPEPEPLPLKVLSVGGTAGKKANDAYVLSLGVDIRNPNRDRMAWDIQLDVTLKDENGEVITVIGDRIRSVDPGTVFHYGVTRRICGATVAHISASVRTGRFSRLTSPVMNRLKLCRAALVRNQPVAQLNGTLNNQYDRELRSCILHYQFLNADGKIVGGGNEWICQPIPAGGELRFSANCPVLSKNASKIVYSTDPDPSDLVD